MHSSRAPRGINKNRRFEEIPNPKLQIPRPRSEEHTSELQSQSNLVCRLLLEKKVNAIDRLAATPGYVERSGPAFTAGVGGGGGGGGGGGAGGAGVRDDRASAAGERVSRIRRT